MSEIRATTISDLVGTGPATLTGQSAAKAWSNLNGTGTIAERDSFNISGYVDNGTGDYTFTISSDMSDANYAHSYGGHDDGYSLLTNNTAAAPTAGALRTQCFKNGVGVGDKDHLTAVIHGDLA